MKLKREIDRIQGELRQLFAEDRHLGEVVRARTLGDHRGWQYRPEWEGNLEQLTAALERLPKVRQEIDSKRAEFVALVDRWHKAEDAEYARQRQNR